MSSPEYNLRLTSAAVEACKFRERVPALESSSAASKAVLIERETGRQERYVIAAGGKRYEGLREAVGTSATNSSCYVAVSINGDGMTLTPLGEWYAFRPEATHKTIGLEDAEMLMERSDKKSKLADLKLERLLKQKEEEEEDDGEGSGGKKKGKELRGDIAASAGAGGSGGGHVERGGGMDDDDDFDDGAEPGWAARADNDEDGNEGLDMADEDLFEDDEDDTFAATKAREMQFGCVATDREESEHYQAVEESRAQFEERRIKQLSDLAQGQEERGLELAADDEEELERVGGDTEWGRRTKEDLKAERAQRRREEDSEDEDDDDDFDDEAEDMKEFLRQSAAAEAAAGTSQGSAAAAGKAPAPVTVAGGKRTLSPADGAGSDGVLDAGAAKRVKQEREQQLERTAAAAAAASGTASVRVEEKDVVLLIHKRGKMTLKDLVTEFKAYTSQSKEHKKQFLQLIAAIAFTAESEGVKFVKLKEATLAKYDLDEPSQ